MNKQRCVALGDAVIIAPPGSSVSADGRTVHAKGIGTCPAHTGGKGAADGPTGGEFIDAETAATHLPRGSTLCGATRFLLLGGRGGTARGRLRVCRGS